MMFRESLYLFSKVGASARIPRRCRRADRVIFSFFLLYVLGGLLGLLVVR